jgi:hypothetical protein
MAVKNKGLIILPITLIKGITMNRTIVKSSILATAAIALVGCGGASGVITSSTPVTNATTVSEFGDGSGVARTIDTNGDTTFTIMTSGIAAKVNDGKNYVGGIAIPDMVNQTVVATVNPGTSTAGAGTYYTGTATINGITVDVDSIVSLSENAATAYFHDAATNAAVFVMAGGTTATNLPTGTYTYTGANMLAARDGSSNEMGTFNMYMNFSTGKADIVGNTATSTFTGTSISVDTSTGNFTKQAISMSGGGGVLTGFITGQFNGIGAKSVSGIYHDDAIDPVFVGIFAGDRP